MSIIHTASGWTHDAAPGWTHDAASGRTPHDASGRPDDAPPTPQPAHAGLWPQWGYGHVHSSTSADEEVLPGQAREQQEEVPQQEEEKEGRLH